MKKSPIPLGLDGIYIGRDQSALSSELNEGKSRLNNSSNNNTLNNNINNNNSSNNIINKNISTKNISSNNNNANNANNNNGIFKPVNLSPTRPPLSPPNTNKKYVLPSTVRIDQNISPSRIQQQQQIQQTQLNVINENDNTSIHSSSTTSSSSSSSNNSNINKDNNNNHNHKDKTGIASNSSNVGKNLPNNVFPSPISTANIDRTTSPPPPLPPSHSSSSSSPPLTTTSSTKISKNEQERISPTPKKIVPSQSQQPQQQQQQQQGSKSQPSSNKNSPKSSPKTKNKSPQPSPKTNKKNISTEKKTNTINSQRSKSPKQDNKNDGLVGKTLRSQKMEMRIKSAVENEDMSVTSSSSSGTDENQEHTSVTSSSSSASNSNSTSTSPSRNKIYEPDMNTYGLNGSLATRTKRMLEKQAKIEGFDKNNERRNGKKDEKQEHEIKDLSQTDSTTSKTKQNEKDNNNNNNNNSSKIKDNSTDSIIVNEIFDDPNSKEELKIPQSNPLQLPYPTSPYPPYFYNYHPNYPQSLPNYPPGYGIPYYHQYPHQLQTGPNTLSPNGYPPYPGNPYYPYPFPDPNNPAFLQQQQQQMPSSPSLSSTIASLSNLQSSNTDLQSMMLMNQLGAISKQLSGLNNTTVDSEEYLNLMKIFQQITSGLMEQSTLFQQQQFHNETAENERRLKQEDLTRMLQNQINSLQNQLQEHLRKMEEEKRLFEEKERELRLKELREREERERLREIQERQEKEDREQRERIEREEREEREKLRIQAENQVKEERERIRLLREQQEKDEKERLRELREKIEQNEREERERLREIREREEREERERLKEIRERVEREEREEKERLREIRERIEKEEREEMERLRIIREREEKEALQRKLQREAQELEEARLRNLSQESDGGASLATVVNSIRYKHKSPYDDDQLTPEMREMAEEHRRRTGKELPRVLYRLVPHRSKFRRANELFDSNIHVDRVAEDDESLHSYTSESIRHILTKQYSTNTNTSSRISSSSSTSSNSRNSNSSSSQILQHQQSLPINFNKTIITDPIVLPQQTRFSCDNPLLNSKDDFWIEPKLSITAENSSPETSPTTDRSSNTNSSGYSFFGASYDSIKKILRRKTLWSDTPPEIPLPLNINIDNIPIDKKRMKRGSKDDLEIERKTNLLSLSAAHLRHVNLTSSSTVRHKKSE